MDSFVLDWSLWGLRCSVPAGTKHIPEGTRAVPEIGLARFLVCLLEACQHSLVSSMAAQMWKYLDWKGIEHHKEQIQNISIPCFKLLVPPSLTPFQRISMLILFGQPTVLRLPKLIKNKAGEDTSRYVKPVKAYTWYILPWLLPFLHKAYIDL